MNAVCRGARSVATGWAAVVVLGLAGFACGSAAAQGGATGSARLTPASYGSPFASLGGSTPRASTSARPASAAQVTPAVPPPPSITTVSPSEGSTEGEPGNKLEIFFDRGVQISGEHLAGATEVKFGGVRAADFKIRSENVVEAEPPAHEAQSPEDEGGFVSVSVTTPGGTVEKPAAYRYGPVVESVENTEDGRNEGSTNPPIRCLELEKTLAECSETGEQSAGIWVRIKGVGFTAGSSPTSVHFGESCVHVGAISHLGCSSESTASPDVRVISDTLIEALAPKYAVENHAFGRGAPVDVRVTSGRGTSAKGPGDHYYFGPVVESVAPIEGSYKGGTTVLIKGHGFERSQLVCKEETEKPLSECTGAGEREIEVIPIVESVKFGPKTLVEDATSLKWKVLSATEIEAEAPPQRVGNAELADVTVTANERGEEGTNRTSSLDTETDATHFYYGPVVTGVTPRGGPVTGGGSATINGHGFEVCNETTKTLEQCPEASEREKASEVRFGGTAAGHIEVKSAEEIAVEGIPAHAAAAVDVVVYLPGGVHRASENDVYAYGVPLIEHISPEVGDENGNVEVTITGRNFKEVKEVLFSGRPAEFTEKSETEIRALTPRATNFSTSAVPVTVVTASGTSPESGVAHYKTTPEPQVLKLEPNSIATNGGTRVVIRGKNFAGIKAVEFGGVPASFTLKAAGEGEAGIGEIVATAPPSAPRSGYVRVIAVGGTSSPGAGSHFTYPAFGIEPGSFQVAPCGTPFNPPLNAEEPITSLETFCNYEDSSPSEFFTQAAGTPQSMVVAFNINSTEVPQGEPGNQQPAGILKNARVDFAPGFNFDVQNVKEECPLEEFTDPAGAACPAGSIVGIAEVRGSTQFLNLPGTDETIYHPIFLIASPAGVPAELGFNSLKVGTHVTTIFIRGGLSSNVESEAEHGGLVTGDYHVFSTVEKASDEETPASFSRILLAGNAAKGPFITMPSACTSSLTYHARVESYSHEEFEELVPPGVGNEVSEAATTTHTPAGDIPVTGCGKVPFHPSVEVTPETHAAGQPDGATVTVKVPHGTNPETADPKQITVALPEGMTVNPSSANGLESCTDKQFGVKETEPGSGAFEEHPLRTEAGPPNCPAGSKIGTFQVKTPDLPTEACKTPGKVLGECPSASEREQTPLEGGVYVAQPVPGKGPESGELYRVFLAAESHRFGVQVRQLGSVSANAQTGRLETTVETPQLPFTEATVKFNGGPKASLANPVACSAGGTVGKFVPYGGSEGPGAVDTESPFNLEMCPFSPPFTLSQAAGTSSTQAGANTTFTLEWTRPRGQAYLAATSTTLPPGLTGSIASVPVLCNEEQANAGACPAESQIGTVLTAAGEGEPEAGEGLFNSKNLITLSGQVYLTTGYQGSPYGLAIVVPAEHVGPYNFGKIVTRAGIQVNEETAQVTTTSTVPTIVSGAPVRLREATLAPEFVCGLIPERLDIDVPGGDEGDGGQLPVPGLALAGVIALQAATSLAQLIPDPALALHELDRVQRSAQLVLLGELCCSWEAVWWLVAKTGHTLKTEPLGRSTGEITCQFLSAQPINFFA